MVERDDPRRYVSNSEGAPPVPPPGGYRGARRIGPGASGPTPLPVAAPVPPIAPAGGHRLGDGTGPRDGAAPAPSGAQRGPLGWIALGAAVAFALVLLIMVAAGAVSALYGTTVLVLQLVVVGVVVAALCTRRGRVLGAAALAVALVLNVATIGGLGAVRAAALGGYEDRKTPEQKLWEAYPGIKDRDPQAILAQAPLEDVRAISESTMADVRDQLSAAFGVTWTKVGDETLRPERNGYGGESMLVQYGSPVWATNEPVTGYAHKLEMMRMIERIVEAHGYRDMLAFNDPKTGLDPAVIAKMYGGADPASQVNWEWYTDRLDDPGLFYANITDLANDRTGEYRDSRTKTAARTGEPIEGLQLQAVAHGMLSADRAQAFRDAIKKYP